MGLVILKVRDEKFKISIPVNKATRFLNAISSLYYNLAENNKSEHKRNLKEFNLEISKLHFSTAEFQLINPFAQRTLIPGDDVYSLPIRDLIRIFNLLSRGSHKSYETFKELKDLIPDNVLRRKIIDNCLYLCPYESTNEIDITYKSKDILSGSLSYNNINIKYRDAIRNWKSLNKAELISEREIIGVVKGIITTTENPYIYVESEENKIIKCFYSKNSFKKDLQISDLRVTEDIIFVSGTYLIMESKKAYDQMILIKDILKVEMDFDFNDEKVLEEWSKISEESLKEIYDDESRNYTERDARGSYI